MLQVHRHSFLTYLCTSAHALLLLLLLHFAAAALLARLTEQSCWSYIQDTRTSSRVCDVVHIQVQCAWHGHQDELLSLRNVLLGEHSAVA